MARSNLREPLLEMISSGSPDVLCYLQLVRTRKIVVFQPTLDQCLLVACNKGSKLYVTYLLQAGADLETRDCHGNTPLLVAATIGLVDIGSLLIKHEADVNATNSKERTALMVAAEHGFPSIVSMLIQKMADVNHVDQDGNTSLILSMRRGCPVEVAEILLKQKGLDIEHRNKTGETALTTALKEMELEKVKKLLVGGASLSGVKEIKKCRKKIRAECAQDIANKVGLGQVVRLIQEYKSDQSILLEAVLKRDLTSVKWLLETELVKIEEVNKKDPLIIFKLLSSIDERKYIVTWVDIKITKLLLSHGLAVDDKGSEVMLAADIGDVSLVEVFCQHGVLVPYQAMVVSAAKGRTYVINLLIKHRVGVNQLYKNNLPVFAGSALESALRNGALECAEILLQNNAKMNVPLALHTVVTHRQKECLTMIAERYTSACQEAVCSSTSELLLSAASTSNVGVVKVLLELGADVNQIVSGNTP